MFGPFRWSNSPYPGQTALSKINTTPPGGWGNHSHMDFFDNDYGYYGIQDQDVNQANRDFWSAMGTQLISGATSGDALQFARSIGMSVPAGMQARRESLSNQSSRRIKEEEFQSEQKSRKIAQDTAEFNLGSAKEKKGREDLLRQKLAEGLPGFDHMVQDALTDPDLTPSEVMTWGRRWDILKTKASIDFDDATVNAIDSFAKDLATATGRTELYEQAQQQVLGNAAVLMGITPEELQARNLQKYNLDMDRDRASIRASNALANQRNLNPMGGMGGQWPSWIPKPNYGNFDASKMSDSFDQYSTVLKNMEQQGTDELTKAAGFFGFDPRELRAKGLTQEQKKIIDPSNKKSYIANKIAQDQEIQGAAIQQTLGMDPTQMIRDQMLARFMMLSENQLDAMLVGIPPELQSNLVQIQKIPDDMTRKRAKAQLINWMNALSLSVEPDEQQLGQ